jgi:FixJ family two-component response regulator
VLLTDMVMPGINGYELARKMRAARPDTTVLYMSGYTEHAAISHGELKDDAGFLQKPFTRETLVEAVRRALSSSE